MSRNPIARVVAQLRMKVIQRKEEKADCLQCGGYGDIYDDSYISHRYECGTLITCGACKGTGVER